MTSNIYIAFGRPVHGWLPLTLKVNDDVLEIIASAVPRDTISELAGALAFLLKGGLSASVMCHEEPTVHDLRFIANENRVVLTVISFSDRSQGEQCRRQVIKVDGGKWELCLAFWRAMRRLQVSMQSNEYEQAWGHPFPGAKLDEITALIKGAKITRSTRDSPSTGQSD